MFISKHGESWESWIEKAVSEGCDIDELSRLMVQGGWAKSDAEKALAEASGSPVKPKSIQKRPSIPSETTIEIEGHAVRILCRLDYPYAILIENLITEEEADSLLGIMQSKDLSSSKVVDPNSGGSIAHSARTSSGIFLTDDSSPILDTISRRISLLTDWPEENAEQLQILQYEKGQEYQAHYDWFNSDSEGGANHLSSGGQRVGTTVIYLQSADEGGATRFPASGFEVSPKKGDAIFFANVDEYGDVDNNTLHAGTPVIEGVKIVATYWQRMYSRKPTTA